MRNIVIRRATLGDADVLADICRSSFPDSLLWTGPRFLSQKWWKAVINSDSAETWVCLKDGEIGSLGVLVTDMAGWKKEKLYPERNMCVRLFALAMCPRLIISKIVKLISAAKAPVSNCPTSNIARTNIESQIWLRLIAVSPQMRRQGLAKRILQLCEERALERHRQAIQLFVFSNNKTPRSFFVQQGFVCTNHRRKGCVYTKVLGD